MKRENKGTIIKFVPAAAGFLVVMYLMFLPGKYIPKDEKLNKLQVDKWVHVAAFAMLAFLFCWPVYKSAFTNKEKLNFFVKIGAAISLWGLIIELIQIKIPGRGFDKYDWLADTIGVLIGFWFVTELKALNKDIPYQSATQEKLNSRTQLAT